MLLNAHQQWALAKLWARQALTLPPLQHDRMLQRALTMAWLGGWQWQHPDDPTTARVPCSPAMLAEMGFPQHG